MFYNIKSFQDFVFQGKWIDLEHGSAIFNAKSLIWTIFLLTNTEQELQIKKGKKNTLVFLLSLSHPFITWGF